jgi:hypothetical protein
MLLLQQIQQVGGAPDAQETPDGVEDEVDSALRRHGGSSIKSQTTHCSTTNETDDAQDRRGRSALVRSAEAGHEPRISRNTSDSFDRNT